MGNQDTTIDALGKQNSSLGGRQNHANSDTREHVTCYGVKQFALGTLYMQSQNKLAQTAEGNKL